MDNSDSPPPDYAEAVGSSSRAGPSTRPTSQPPLTPRTPASTSYGFPDEKRSPYSPQAQQHHQSAIIGSHPSPSRSSGWIPDLWAWRTEAKTDSEVKKTVQSLIQDVITDPSRADTLPILQSCLAACRARNVSFEDLVQRLYISGHTPLYWAILGSRKAHPEGLSIDGAQSVLDLLVSFPLNDRTTLDACHACMTNSDNALFQRLRLSPGFARTTFADSVITGGQANEPVYVEHVPNAGAGEFTISCTISNWISRMRVAKGVSVDFIARGRGWRLQFTVATEYDVVNNIQPGTWCAVLRLLKGSAPTLVSAKIMIPAVTQSSQGGTMEPIEIPFRTTRRGKLSAQDHSDLECVDKIVTRLDSLPHGSSLEFE
ncbi:hypothetical protein DACRYDRAFT_108206 [Dacryopinax primogenitus]|uniref:Uncharacterized protein n=1 Tax=Dacryopinax primogenitus (strain DJM 731) TaxID=1858805 RepID=M5G784_DACPD|nr:uncharacterized protein DACRYDRAFT_108206 [Dacryopinax primogenitus]EJU01677.1 hypothetical protein DACRYDRAFT_108206 [Dacryopinax primogenitus]